MVSDIRTPQGIGSLSYIPDKYGVSPFAWPTGTSSVVSSLGSMAGAIPIIGNVAGGLLNYFSQQSANKQAQENFERQLKFQADMMDKQWQRESAFKSEMAQVQRMKQAGLNPSLMFKGAQGASASMASAPDAPSLKAPVVDNQFGSNLIGGLQGSIDMLSQSEKNQALIKTLSKEAEKHGADSEFQKQWTGFLRATFDERVMSTRMNIAEQQERIGLMVQQAANNASQALLNKTEVAGYMKKLGIEVYKADSAFKAALSSASAMRYSADKNLEAAKYSADKHQETSMAISQSELFTRFEIEMNKLGVEKEKTQSLVDYLKKSGNLNQMQMYLAPLNTLISAFGAITNGLGNSGAAATVIKGFAAF